MSEMSIESAEVEADQPEVILAFTSDGGDLSVQALPRDEQPNRESIAVILASYIACNIDNLVEQAQEAKARSESAVQAAPDSAGADLRVIASRPVRSVTTVEGGLANEGARLVGQDGRPLS